MNKPKYYYFSDIDNKKEYIELKENKFLKKKVHNGQLKLLLVVIQFFNNLNIKDYCEERKNDDEISILYIGSGKGYNIPILINMLKSRLHNNIVWYLYDPNGHCVTLNNWSNSKNIIVNDKLFLEEDIDIFKSKKNILFISDIRSSDYEEPSTLDLLRDYKLQNFIIKELKPDYSLLKHRYPFPDGWKNEYQLELPIGIEFIQPFAPVHSTELRLFLSKNIIFKKVQLDDLIEHEEKMFYYNTECRYKFNNEKLIFLNDNIISYYIINNINKILKENINIQDMSEKDVLNYFIKMIEKEKRNRDNVYISRAN